jgi:hypothetical protein
LLLLEGLDDRTTVSPHREQNIELKTAAGVL